MIIPPNIIWINDDVVLLWVVRGVVYCYVFKSKSCVELICSDDNDATDTMGSILYSVVTVYVNVDIIERVIAQMNI